MWINALRGHHWAKKSAALLPLAALAQPRVEPIVRTFCGFVLYGFAPLDSTFSTTFSICIPIASIHGKRSVPSRGDISIPQGLLARFGIALLALGLGFCSTSIGLVLLGYSALDHAVFALSQEDCSARRLRSFQFLQLPHSRRALISATPLSQWFLAFSMFFFLSLAMAKRYSELLHASDLVKAGNSGRGYHTATANSAFARRRQQFFRGRHLQPLRSQSGSTSCSTLRRSFFFCFAPSFFIGSAEPGCWRIAEN
jgi:hypothetical protein